MSENFDWGARHDTREHEELIADIMRQNKEAGVLARADAGRDVAQLLARLGVNPEPPVEKPRFVMNFSEIREDMLGHLGIDCLTNWLKRK
jgi:hypothetical protein